MERALSKPNEPLAFISPPTMPLAEITDCTTASGRGQNSPRRCHIFVVEEDPTARATLCRYLEGQGVTVTALASVEDLLQQMTQQRPDLIILDVAPPRNSGLDGCRRLRVHGDQTPILLLSTCGDPFERVLGLEMGADDFVTKPFFPRELLARARAILRRIDRNPGGTQHWGHPLKIGEMYFDPMRRSLRCGDRERLLGAVEFSLLSTLTINAGVAMSRERLMAGSLSRAEDISLRAVDITISRLRRVVEPDPALPRFIQTVRGYGYIFVRNEDGRKW